MPAEPACTCTDAAFIARYEGHGLVPHLVRLLARGRPLPLEELAEVTGQPPERIGSSLGSQPGTEWDEDGRLVGFGLTLRPTRHRFVVDGHDLYTWCATDTLLFTVILGRDTTVDSHCPATGQAIHLQLSPEGPVSVEPAMTVVSEVTTASSVEDFRASVCEHGHFFTSAEDAQPWLREHTDGRLLSLAEAFGAARSACQTLGWVGPAAARR